MNYWVCLIVSLLLFHGNAMDYIGVAKFHFCKFTEQKNIFVLFRKMEIMLNIVIYEGTAGTFWPFVDCRCHS